MTRKGGLTKRLEPDQRRKGQHAAAYWRICTCFFPLRGDDVVGGKKKDLEGEIIKQASKGDV